MVPRRAGRPGVQVHSETRGSVLIVMLAGRIDGANAYQFKRMMDATVADHSGSVIIDCENLGELTSAGLSAFLILARALEKEVNGFTFCSLSERIAGIFQMTGFDKIIPICGSREEAFARIEG